MMVSLTLVMTVAVVMARLLDHKRDDTMRLRRRYLRLDTASHDRRLESSETPLWEHQISHKCVG
jgi:hypothetical protein